MVPVHKQCCKYRQLSMAFKISRDNLMLHPRLRIKSIKRINTLLHCVAHRSLQGQRPEEIWWSNSNLCLALSCLTLSCLDGSGLGGSLSSDDSIPFMHKLNFLGVFERQAVAWSISFSMDRVRLLLSVEFELELVTALFCVHFKWSLSKCLE